MCAALRSARPVWRAAVAEAALDRRTIEQAEAISGQAPLLVALSGGGDSTALLHLLAERLGAPRLLAIVIDHGLRDGSADDAARAAGFAAGLGVESKVLRLAWPDGPKRAQADAREKRYAALCDAARAVNAACIALGHTRDDQAETVLLRAVRGSSWRGLAGMRALAPAPLWPEGRGVMLARPLLHARRDALRAELRSRGAAWIEDPANSNTDFARVRARQKLAALEARGFDPMRFAALAEELSPRAAALDRAAGDLVARAVRFEADIARIGLSEWASAAAVRAHALAALIAAAAGAPRAPGADQAAALEAQLNAPDFKAATLGGALIRRRGGAVLLSRDPGALAGRADGAGPLAPAPLPLGKTMVWDGRLELRMAEPGWEIAAEAGAPVLVRGRKRAPLEAADPRWLLAARCAHALGL